MYYNLNLETLPFRSFRYHEILILHSIGNVSEQKTDIQQYILIHINIFREKQLSKVFLVFPLIIRDVQDQNKILWYYWDVLPRCQRRISGFMSIKIQAKNIGHLAVGHFLAKVFYSHLHHTHLIFCQKRLVYQLLIIIRFIWTYT